MVRGRTTGLMFRREKDERSNRREMLLKVKTVMREMPQLDALRLVKEIFGLNVCEHVGEVIH